MAEINNSIATGIAVAPPLDPYKAIGVLSEMQRAGLVGLEARQKQRELTGYGILQSGGNLDEAVRAGLPPSVGASEQARRHEADLYKRGGGYTPAEASALASTQNTRAETQNRQAELSGRAGNVILQGKGSPQAVGQALDILQSAGRVSPQDRQKYLSMPPDQIMQYGANLAAHGQTATQFSETSGNSAFNQHSAAAPFTYHTLPTEGGTQGVFSGEQLYARQQQINRAAQQFQPAPAGGPPAAAAASPVPSTIAPPPQAWPGAQPAVAPPGPSGAPAGGIGSPAPAPVPPAAPIRAPIAPVQASPQPAPPVMPPPVPITQSRTPEATKAAEGMAATGVERFTAARNNYDNAQPAHTNLIELNDALRGMTDEKGGFLQPGRGASGRVQVAKMVNTAYQAMGYEPLFDPKRIADAELAQKTTTRLGFDTAKVLGSRESQMIVTQSVGIQPGIDNTPEGRRKIMGALTAVVMRDKMLYEFLAQHNNPTGPAATLEFNREHPPREFVALARKFSELPDKAFDILRERATGANARAEMERFDNQFGAQGLARMVLGD